MATTLVTPATPSVDTTRTDWVAVARQLGPTFAARAAAHDANDSFVADNYAELKQHKVFSAGVAGGVGAVGRRTLHCAPCCASWRMPVAQRHWRCRCTTTCWRRRSGAGARGSL